MSTINVSFSPCELTCTEPSTDKSPTVQWLHDETVASIDSIVIPPKKPNPFQAGLEPSSANGWVGTLLTDWIDQYFTYTITITPSGGDTGCANSSFQKTPTIKVSAPWTPPE